MPKEVSALNTYWLLQYLHERYSTLDLQGLIDQISRMFPCYVENLQTGQVERVTLRHLQNPRYWFSHRFVKALHDLIEERIPDPKLGFKIGSTIYKTQPLTRTALGIPFLGVRGAAARISREAAKYNRTKEYTLQQIGTGHVKIRITHHPGIVVSTFTIQWNAGCFASYARLAGATDITFDLHCIDPGPAGPDDASRAIWDIELRFQEPWLLIRLFKTVLYSLPWVRELTERAEAIEEEHQEQILNRDAIIGERTAGLARANETLRLEITERRRAEALLQQSKDQLERYITAIDDIGMGLCVIDADYRVCVMNKTLTSWFGDHCGDLCYRTIMGQESPCTHCRLRDINLQRSKTHSIRTADRIFEIVATPIFNIDGTVSKMEIFRDITEQKKQEERRVKFSRQEEQLKKFDSLKTMAGAIAHRFNNAMMGVQGNLEFMTFRLPADSDEYRIASQALQSAKGASQIGTMMLSYVGQQPRQLKETSFFDLVRDTVTASKHLSHPEITLKCTPPSQPLYCFVDQEQMQEVIESVLSNAVESMDGDTGAIEITFGTAYFTTDSFPVFFQDNTLKGGMYTFCQIKDSGHGISPEDLAQIFEPFYTTRFIGRGLGLALTVGIMRAHHGAVTVESSPDSGTTVKVLLPAILQPRPGQ